MPKKKKWKKEKACDSKIITLLSKEMPNENASENERNGMRLKPS